MQLCIHLNGITLHKISCCLIVALALYALNLSKQLGYKSAKLRIIRDFNVCLTIALNHLDGIAFLIAPMGYKGTVAHVGLFYLIAWGDTYKLSHQTVHHICVILRHIRLFIGHQTKLYQLWVGYVIQSEEIGSRLFYRTAISLQRIRVYTWKQLSATMT